MADPPIYDDEYERLLRCEKLSLEKEKLLEELSPASRRLDRLRAIASASGTITAFIAVIGIALTAIQWRSNVEQAQESRASERLITAVAQLAAERDQQRLAGVAGLTLFLQEENGSRKLQVLRAYANALAVEPSELVRNAIIDATADVDAGHLSGTDRTRAITLVVRINRLVFDSSRSRSLSAEQKQAAETRAQALGQMIAALFRRGLQTTDLRDTYLKDVDFSNVSFPIRTDFRRAVLRGTSFNSATLPLASFQSTSLDRTSFVGAQLKGADFTWPDMHAYEYGQRLSALTRHTKLLGSVIMAANFDCSDLSDANFAGYPLFTLFEDRGEAVLGTPRMRYARFRGTDLREAVVIGNLSKWQESQGLGRHKSWDTPLYGVRSFFSPENSEETLLDIGQFMSLHDRKFSHIPTPAALSDISFSGEQISRNLDGTPWREARLPPALAAILAKYGEPRSSVTRPCPASAYR